MASELQGVQRIMFDNIGAVLKRGEMIESESWTNSKLGMVQIYTLYHVGRVGVTLG